MEYKVSIIVPVYKVEQEYLKKCIDSIKNQTYKNYECIVLCDGANEETQNYVKQYTENDSKFKVVIKENTGVSDTRNLGINLCSGEYITFLDADDWLENNALECFNGCVEENIDFDIFKTNIVKNNINKKYEVKKSYNHYIDQNEKNLLFQSVYGAKDGGYHWIESVWAKFYKKDFINKEKIKFTRDINVGEDLLFNFDVWDKSNLGMFVNKEIYNYRVNENSVMNSDYNKLLSNYRKLNEKLLGRIDSLKNEYEIMKKCSGYDNSVKCYEYFWNQKNFVIVIKRKMRYNVFVKEKGIMVEINVGRKRNKRISR